VSAKFYDVNGFRLGLMLASNWQGQTEKENVAFRSAINTVHWFCVSRNVHLFPYIVCKWATSISVYLINF